MLVLVAVEGDSAKKLGRVRFRIVNSHASENIKAFLDDYIEECSTIVTDGLSSYDFLDKENSSFKYEKNVLSGKNKRKGW